MPVFRTVKDARSGSIRLEAIHQPLYDSTTITTANGTVQFFAQGVNGRGPLDTNLQTQSNLSWPKRFSIRAVRQVAAIGTTLFTDFANFAARALYKVTVGEKPYLTIPAFLITAGTGLEAQTVVPATATTSGSIYSNHGRPDQRSIYGLLHSIYLPPVQNFSVELSFASSTTISSNFKLWFFLEGELLREIQ